MEIKRQHSTLPSRDRPTLIYLPLDRYEAETLVVGEQASVQDRDAAADVVAQACTKVPGLEKLYADGAYGGKCAQAIEQTHGISVEIVRYPGNRSTGTWQDAQAPLWPEVVAKGFVVQAKRWVVERTHAWNERSRRLIAHHDRSDWAPLAWVWLAEARMLATRLAG